MRSKIEKRASETRSWGKLIDTIYALKIEQVILILLLGTLLFYGLDYFASAYSQQLAILRYIPLRALADACFTALIVGITYEWIVRKESEGKLRDLFEETLSQNNTNILEEIPRALMINKSVMERVLKDSRVEDIIRTGLQIQLGDEQLGNDIYDGLLRKTLSYDERWTNYRYKVTLTSIKGEAFSEEVRDRFYQAYIDLRYETRLRKDQFWFTCVSTIEELNTLFKDPRYQTRWLFPLSKEIPSIDENVFNVGYMNVGGIDLNIKREITPEGRLLITCSHPDLEAMMGEPVTIHYRYEVKLEKRGHLFMVTVVNPTKGVSMELDYAETDIHYVNVLDFFVSTEKPIIRYAPSREHPHKIEVELNEWVFPKGGAVFVWVLKQEMNSRFVNLLKSK